jgi:hypothetical protein
MMELCLLAAGIVVRLGTVALTLAWTHSIEKTRWEEDYRATQAGIVLTQDRIQSTGAGMEPPPDAKFDGKWWRYTPALPPQRQIVLRRSGATADWQVCIQGQCKPMASYLPDKDADPVTLATCP